MVVAVPNGSEDLRCIIDRIDGDGGAVFGCAEGGAATDRLGIGRAAGCAGDSIPGAEAEAGGAVGIGIGHKTQPVAGAQQQGCGAEIHQASGAANSGPGVGSIELELPAALAVIEKREGDGLGHTSARRRRFIGRLADAAVNDDLCHRVAGVAAIG